MVWRETPGKDFGRVSPMLLSLLQRAAESSPYTVEAYSGYREGDPRQHGRGHATDVRLIDPKTGKALPNYQDPAAFKAYQQYANTVYGAATPEQQKQLRWGGYFSGGKGKYGALDLMHFDYGSGMPMAGGSWAEGLTPQQAKVWGLDAGGGTGYTPQAPGTPAPALAPPQTVGAPPAVAPATAPATPATAPLVASAAPAAQPGMMGWLKGHLKTGDKGDDARKNLATAMSGMAGKQQTIPQIVQPKAARVDDPTIATIDPQQALMQKQQLAEIMARLNSGKLYG